VAKAQKNTLEAAIGREVRFFRKKFDMTVVELAKAAGLSAGMLSRIENGRTSPSLATLQMLATALHVPVTALFRRFDEGRDATFVPAGRGMTIERRGTRAGYEYLLLGHTLSKSIAFEPYLITLTSDSEAFPTFQHAGFEFLYGLEGKVNYRHGDKNYVISPGDSLFFHADTPHGPEIMLELPVRFLSIMVYSRFQEE